MSGWKKVGLNSSTTLSPGEFLIATQDGVRLDIDKDKKVFGDVTLTSHRLIWSKSSYDHDLNLSLSAVLLFEQEEGGLMSSDKINLTLMDPTTTAQSVSRLAFKQGGQKQFANKLHQALAQRQWEIKIVRPVRKAPVATRSGIGGIQKSMQKKLQQTDSEISKAFQDINKLVEMAKPMVGLAKSISNKIKEKPGQGTSEDEETVQFKSYLMSLGIADPVTRDTHGSGQSYYKQLAKEIYNILEKPLQENGGMMTLTDAFCRVNRARGMVLLSPEDLINACKTFDGGQLPIRLHTFAGAGTGVTVLQLSSAQVDGEQVVAETEKRVSGFSKDGVTAEEFARLSGTALVIAKERLLAAENCGRICRDDTIEGLKFFPNLILSADN